MKNLIILPMLAAWAFPFIVRAATAPQPKDPACSTYFGVLQYDPNIPGSFVARMTRSQAKWFAKNGPTQYPGVCLSLEQAQYLIVWTVSTEARTIETTQTRSAQVNTTSTGQESGSFSAYGSLSMRGTYSGTSSSFSTSNIIYQESVPVSLVAQRCSAYVLKSVGATIWDDIRNKTPQPPVIFAAEARGPERAQGQVDPGTGAGLILGQMASLAARREPTKDTLNAALKFIAAQPLSTPNSAATLLPASLQQGSAPTADSPTQAPAAFKSGPEGADTTAQPPKSKDETVVIGTTTLGLGMSKDAVLSALGMQYNLMAWPNMAPPSSRYSIKEGKSNLVGVVAFDGQVLTEAEKEWNPENRHYSDGEIGRILVALFSTLVSQGKQACSVSTSGTPPVLQDGHEAPSMIRETKFKCGDKLIRMSTTTQDGVDWLSITEEIGSI